MLWRCGLDVSPSGCFIYREYLFVKRTTVSFPRTVLYAERYRGGTLGKGADFIAAKSRSETLRKVTWQTERCDIVNPLLKACNKSKQV